MAANPFEVIEARNAELAKLLETNHSLSAYLMGVIEASLDFCKTRGGKFEDLEVTEAFIHEDGGVAQIRGRLSFR